MEALRAEKLEDLGRRFFSSEDVINSTAEKYTRVQLCSLLRELSGQLQSLVAEMTPAQVTYRLPGAPAGWDASDDEAHFDTSQIVTHVAVGTSFYWLGISRAVGSERPTFPQAPQGARLTGKEGEVRGRGGWESVRADRLAQLLSSAMISFLDYVMSLPDDADQRISAYHPGYNDLTVRGWLLLLAVHYRMHLNQVREMQAQPDYP